MIHNSVTKTFASIYFIALPTKYVNYAGADYTCLLFIGILSAIEFLVKTTMEFKLRREFQLPNAWKWWCYNTKNNFKVFAAISYFVIPFAVIFISIAGCVISSRTEHSISLFLFILFVQLVDLSIFGMARGIALIWYTLEKEI